MAGEPPAAPGKGGENKRPHRPGFRLAVRAVVAEKVRYCQALSPCAASMALANRPVSSSLPPAAPPDQKRPPPIDLVLASARPADHLPISTPAKLAKSTRGRSTGRVCRSCTLPSSGNSVVPGVRKTAAGSAAAWERWAYVLEQPDLMSRQSGLASWLRLRCLRSTPHSSSHSPKARGRLPPGAA